MVISVNAENDFDKIQHPFMIKTSESELRGNKPQFDKEHLQKPTANIILNAEKTDAFLMRSGTQ